MNGLELINSKSLEFIPSKKVRQICTESEAKKRFKKMTVDEALKIKKCIRAKCFARMHVIIES